MEIIDYFETDEKEYWLSQLQKSDWGAGKYLHELIVKKKLKELCGKSTKVLMLTENKKLISFCTYAEQDDIREPSLSPWAGFVYTFPEFRGKRYMGKLLDYIHTLAKKEGRTHIYISTGENGVNQKLCRLNTYGKNERGFETVDCNQCRSACPRALGK